MELISYLKTDHKNIRSMLTDIEQTERRELKTDIFVELNDLYNAHFKAEEVALYSIRLKKQNEKLSQLAIKGFEEHQLIEELMEKIKFSLKPELWEAQVRVFCQVLDQHLSEEELEYFPLVEKSFKPVELDRAAVVYLQIKKAEHTKAQQAKKYRIDKDVQFVN
jgi:hemerythrin superfamily protein